MPLPPPGGAICLVLVLWLLEAQERPDGLPRVDLSAAATRAPNSWLDPLDIFKIIMRGCCWLRVVAW